MGSRLVRRGPRRVRQSGPGTYHCEDEQTYAEYEFDVHADGTVTFGIACVKIGDIVTILDALEQALAEHRTA
ncbi:hypothetical protein [Streptomyces sp. NPDC047453]|uniref:hypothetical protein n=1 Tax=Streptomyces sp. NPDC047453 TaxID=3154812 RepID=UPI0033ED90CA